MNPFPRAVTPLVAALAVAGCAALPGAPQDAAPAVVTTPAPARPAAPAAAAAEAATEKSRVFPGSGIFVKNVPSPPPVAGPEEVSLNFEATEIRQVAATILGDILRESFTVHPQVQG
ncbi:MAG TPA: hypothetical protein PLO00_08720, partial [Usitatibacteraceae bacterium]|nr:hypothetical protein [Usitatibacteraceae bacterium]